MLDHGISVRCVLMWVTFSAAAVAWAMGLILEINALSNLAPAVATAGYMLVVLNDNAKTRRVLRVALQEMADDGSARLTRLPR